MTTDFILDELLTLLKARGEFQRALVLGQRILNGTAAQLEWVQATDVLSAWQMFQTHTDKGWSFTDCVVSRVVMTRLGVTAAFAFDDHFRQFGSVVVVP